jgi:hypothetical protein
MNAVPRLPVVVVAEAVVARLAAVVAVLKVDLTEAVAKVDVLVTAKVALKATVKAAAPELKGRRVLKVGKVVVSITKVAIRALVSMRKAGVKILVRVLQNLKAQQRAINQNSKRAVATAMVRRVMQKAESLLVVRECPRS